ncbi:hypothetical protein D9M72_491930 [compost metagenome]
MTVTFCATLSTTVESTLVRLSLAFALARGPDRAEPVLQLTSEVFLAHFCATARAAASAPFWTTDFSAYMAPVSTAIAPKPSNTTIVTATIMAVAPRSFSLLVTIRRIALFLCR